MLYWYDMPGALDDLESNVAYLEKMAVDVEVEQESSGTLNKACFKRVNSWVRKRNYKKKMIRRFLSINPDMDYSKFCGTSCSPAIYLCIPSFNDGDYYDPKMTYNFNPYEKIFLSPRGDLRKYHGAVYPVRGSYALGHKDKDNAKITNRRIRHQEIDEEMINNHSYNKKVYGPLVDRIW